MITWIMISVGLFLIGWELRDFKPRPKSVDDLNQSWLIWLFCPLKVPRWQRAWGTLVIIAYIVTPVYLLASCTSGAGQ